MDAMDVETLSASSTMGAGSTDGADTSTTRGSEEGSTGSEDTGGSMREPACPPTLIGESCDRQFILRHPMVDGDGSELFVGNAETILRIDRTTGVTEVFSSAADPSALYAMVGAGTRLEFINDLTIVPGGSIFVLQDFVLHQVDRATGERTAVPEPNLSSVRSIAWDANADRLIVGEFDFADSEATISVLDPATAGRTLISGATDPGPLLTRPAAMAVDPVSGTIYVLNQIGLSVATPEDETFIVAIDPATGARTLVSGQGIGRGPALALSRSLAFSDEGSLFVANFGTLSVLEISIATGDRTDVTSNEGEILEPLDVAVVGDQLIVSDLARSAVYEINRASGDHTPRLTGTLGTGQRFQRPIDVTTDGTRLYVLPRSGEHLLVVDPITGDRDRLGENLPFSGASSIRFASGPDRLYVTDRAERALFSVDIATGDYAVVSDDDDELGDGGAQGAGPGFDSPAGFVLDLDNDRAFVVDRFAYAVIEVDLATGDRSVFSDDDDENGGGVAVGEGPAWIEPDAIALDSGNQRLYVQDDFLDTVFAVSLAPATLGDRSVFSGGDAKSPVGTGPRFTATRFVLDEDGGRLLGPAGYVEEGAGVYALDLQTGDRSVVSSSLSGVGSGWETPSLLGLVRLGKVLYAVDDSGFVVRIDGNGDRWVIASGATEVAE